MKLKKITGRKGRPKIITIEMVDGKVTLPPEGLFMAVEFTEAEKAAVDCPSRCSFE